MTLPWFHSHTAVCPTGQRWSVSFSVSQRVVLAPVLRILGAPPNDDVQVVEILVNGIQQLHPDERVPAYLFTKPYMLSVPLIAGSDTIEIVLRARSSHELTVEYASHLEATHEGWFKPAVSPRDSTRT